VSTFGEHLRQLRVEAGLAQKDLAARTGLSACYISLIESGKRSPRDDVVARLASELNCSVSMLTTGTPQKGDEQLVALELSYAKLAIGAGEAGDAATRLRALLDSDTWMRAYELDEAHHLMATALEKLGDLHGALDLLIPLFERAAGTRPPPTHLPVTTVGIQLIRMYLGAGDHAKSVEVGQAALAVARANDLPTTTPTEFLRLAATVQGAYLVRGDFLTAERFSAEYLREAAQLNAPHGEGALGFNLAQITRSIDETPRRALGIALNALSRLSDLDHARDIVRL
jgi:transcriptional regulator with XRE-family HTH domain